MFSIFNVQEKLKVTRLGNGCGGVLYIYIYIYIMYICIYKHTSIYACSVMSDSLWLRGL